MNKYVQLYCRHRKRPFTLHHIRTYLIDVRWQSVHASALYLSKYSGILFSHQIME